MGLDGMGMMLKSLGINPEEIKASLEGFKTLANNVAETQKGVDAKLSIIVTACARIESKCDEILARSSEVESKEEMADQFANMGAALPAVADPATFETQLESEGENDSGDSPGSN